MKNKIIHSANSRGRTQLKWLDSHHSFSFGAYYDPERINFGALRVLNDDVVAGGMGFGTHPHRDMEIISIPLQGDLIHQDSTGISKIIKQGDVQVMSAGTGIQHSEYNANKDGEVKFLQIWITPNTLNVKPRYQQITLNPADRKNGLQQVLSPDSEDQGVWIYQNAWFNMGTLDRGISLWYPLKDTQKNGVYALVLEGEVTINDQVLERRDGMGIWDVGQLDILANSDAEVLLMEVPIKY